jgi:hypothetical protein
MFNEAFLEYSVSYVGKGRLEINPSVNNKIKPAWSLLARKTITQFINANQFKNFQNFIGLFSLLKR